ncbi:hypothetical protein C7999DRAFT_29842 [Corynascus novoguineensis]|uniref:Uncharacterized protein n=1 Tax=Corynascus novoguineensis TaxID=1126955 RepID=A0AAN7CWI6_9PEZI|nr:hypothetical protein C7999DRAFT_29842 [Corynascus novoguineensis]
MGKKRAHFHSPALPPTPTSTLVTKAATFSARDVSQFKIALAAFAAVLSLGLLLLLLTVFVSVRRRRLAAGNSGCGNRNSRRGFGIRTGIEKTVLRPREEGKGEDGEEGEEKENGASVCGPCCFSAGCYADRGISSVGYLGRMSVVLGDTGSMRGRAATVLRELGRRVSVVALRRARFAPRFSLPRDVEPGMTNSNDFGMIGGQVDGSEAVGRESILKSMDRKGWFLPGECRMRKRALLRASADGESLV